MHKCYRYCIHILLGVLLALGLFACSSSNDLDLERRTIAQLCSDTDAKSEVLALMQEWYLWNDEADQTNKYSIDLSTVSDDEALLDFLRYLPSSRDKNFSFITTPAAEQAFFGEGEFVGFGFSLGVHNNTELRISQVTAGSPAANAGLQRGYRLSLIGGDDATTVWLNGDLGAALGPAETGFTQRFVFDDVSGSALPEVQLTKAVVQLTPVSTVEILRDGSDNVIAGYLALDTFISPASDQLRAAFAQFSDAAVRSVIIDLRYNGGGLVLVADLLGSLIAGPANVGNVFTSDRHNSDKAASLDSSVSFFSEPNSIDLDNVVFITSNASASASELLINGLSPYFQTAGKRFAIVGEPTLGKPVGQFGFDYCNDSKRLRAVTFQTFNVNNFGEYFDGLPVDCAANDDLLTARSNISEDSLAAAVEFINTGSCPAVTSAVPSATNGSAQASEANSKQGPILAPQTISQFYTNIY